MRRRAINRKLRGLGVLPELEAAAVLELAQIDEMDAEEERREAAE